jgi:hypothetical protein
VILRANARGFADVPRPALQRIAAAEADVERAADIALRPLRKAAEFLHFQQCQRAVGGPRLGTHDPTPSTPAEIMRPKRLPTA